MDKPTVFSKILSGTFFTGSGRIFIVVLGLVGFMVSARWLTPEELGAFTLLQVAAVFVANFSDFGINTSITKFLADNTDKNEQHRFIFTAFIFRSIVLILASLISLLAHKILFSMFGSSVYIDLLPFLPILVFLEGFIKFYVSVFEGLFQFKWVGLSDALTSICSFGLIMILVVWQGAGLNGRIYARIFALSIPLILMFFLYPIYRPSKIDYGFLKRIIKFGFPLYINQILSFIFLRADTFIIGALLGPAEIALYEIARKIPESMEMIYDAFRKVYFPMVSQLFSTGDRDQGAGLLNTSTRLITFLGGLMTLFVFLFGKEIIFLLFSSKYTDSSLIFSILMVALVFLMVDYTLGYTLVAVGESNKPPLINIVRTGVNFIGYFTLIKSLGALGAALAGIFGTIVANPINVFFLRRRKIPVGMRFYIKPILIMGFVIFVNMIFSWESVFLRGSMLLLYLGLSYLFSVFTKHDIALIAQIGKQLKEAFTQRFLPRPKEV
ncbi:MAG: hypothetical protein CL609_06095 [Anaerolineaceae bacterium]|nr:hypothetical protein [Anaerolineaceae bacterium]